MDGADCHILLQKEGTGIMAKRSYTYTQALVDVLERLSALETHIPHIQNHLRNIDQHGNTLNERTDKNEKQISRNTDRIAIILRCGAWVAAILGGGGGITAITLKLLGVF